MDSRLSQIIAASIGADGHPDRAKIFAALSLTPEAPEAFLVDAVVASEEVLHRVKKAQSEAIAAGVDAFAKERAALTSILAAHIQLIEDDAVSRRRWLTLAMTIPSVITIVAFVLIWLLMKRGS